MFFALCHVIACINMHLRQLWNVDVHLNSVASGQRYSNRLPPNVSTVLEAKDHENIHTKLGSKDVQTTILQQVAMDRRPATKCCAGVLFLIVDIQFLKCVCLRRT